MVVYIFTDGNVKIVSPENIYQGSTVTEITLLTPFPSTTSMSVGFVMPDGTTLTAQPMSYTQTIVDGQSVTAYTYTLPYTVTEQTGEVQMAFAALFTNGTQTSYLAKFEVQESVLPTPPSQPDEDTYQLILQYVQEAMSNANNAQNAAEAAQVAAESAETKASQAVSTANEANETAGQANETAKQANTKSDSAVTTANNAAATASAANQTAIEAKSAASAAQSAAAQAQEDADAAAKSAQAAETSASEASDSAEEAVTAAQGAVTTANEAKTIADGTDGKATEALENSEQAITTANEAKALAEQAVAGTGTEVYVDNTLQARLDFTSDPQTQINDKQTQIDNIKSGTTKVGAAEQADKLSAARNLKVDLASGNSQAFDGTADAEEIGVKGILPEANGGTGASDLDSVKVGESGAADEAAKLSTARNLQVNLASGNAQSFDGSDNATEIGVKGILPEANGGTGATSLDNIVARKDKQVGGIEATSKAANRYLYNKSIVTAQEPATSTITQAGWYRIAELPSYFEGTLTVIKNYTYGIGFACSINVQVGAVGYTRPQITVMSSNQSANDNNISQVRYTNSSNKSRAYLDVYINYTGKNNWWVFADGVAGYQNIINLFKVHSFTPVDAGNGNYLLNIGTDAGIYSLGNYYSNGSPVLVGSAPTWVTGTSGDLRLPGAGWYVVGTFDNTSGWLNSETFFYWNGTDFLFQPLIRLRGGNTGSLRIEPDGTMRTEQDASGTNIPNNLSYYKLA